MLRTSIQRVTDGLKSDLIGADYESAIYVLHVCTHVFMHCGHRTV